MTSLARQRTAFEKELLANVSPLLKKSKWKKSKNALFNHSGDYYQDVSIWVFGNDLRTRVELGYKPMAIDPIFWDILGIPENTKEPLSFRTWAAFKCSTLPILEEDIESPGDSPVDVATKLVNFCNDNGTLHQSRLLAASFSNQVAAHPNQIQRGTYAATLVTSLIHEGDFSSAYSTAREYMTGKRPSASSFTSNGKSFHQLAMEWIEAGNHSAEAIRRLLENKNNNG